jgi:hypothetical protein
MLALARDDGSTQLVDVVKHDPIGYLNPDEQPAASITIPRESQSEPPNNHAAASVTFNTNGTMVATGSRDGAGHLWGAPKSRRAAWLESSRLVWSEVANQRERPAPEKGF